MNTPNNKRRKLSQEKIEKVFINLLQTKELSEISVSEIIKAAKLNRSTFYANYADIYALADNIRDKLELEVAKLYSDDVGGKYSGYNWIKLFEHIKDNQLFYKTYFKLGYDNSHAVNISDLAAEYKIFSEKHMEYHVEFFKAGFNAMVKKWLMGGCKESPEELNEILISEYKNRKGN